MNSFNFQWIVRIPAGQWMAGTHRFKTKRDANVFVHEWHTAHRHARQEPIPRVEKVCEPCRSHYGDEGRCDEGKPVASPHRQ